MSNLAHSCEETMEEIEQRALFNRDEAGYRISENQ